MEENNVTKKDSLDIKIIEEYVKVYETMKDNIAIREDIDTVIEEYVKVYETMKNNIANGVPISEVILPKKVELDPSDLEPIDFSVYFKREPEEPIDFSVYFKREPKPEKPKEEPEPEVKPSKVIGFHGIHKLMRGGIL